MNLPVSTASWHPPQSGSPLAMTSIRQSSKRWTLGMFKSATLVLVVTRAPASRQIRAAARSNGPPDCVGGRIAHRPSDGRPKALVSPLTREGPPRRRNGQYAGAALQDARHNKERIYPELVASGRCRLVVLALEIGGCWSQETCTFLRLLASHRER